ncbi:MAG: TRC40/GET3/ArsA family transport-energizing ATPase [Myxococcota bacterium]|nr:TRC40/GET3/ArsA family transport-energizing ATPase [Myxococcota bacterium]
MRVLLHTGKGGVGKTTLAVATALRAAQHGHRVFLLSTDTAHSLSDAVGLRIGASPVRIAERVVAQEVGVLDEVDRGWSEIQGWLRELLREDADELVAEELLVFPGMEELMSLRAIRNVEATGDYDVCVVDCAPTGATLRLLRFPDALRIFMEHFFEFERAGARWLRPIARRASAAKLIPREEFFDAFEQLYRDVEDVGQILRDGSRTTARLVVNPARVVVDEARRSFAYLSLYGVGTDAVLINRLLPETQRDSYFSNWVRRETQELKRIEESFPVPLLRAPLLEREPIGVDALDELGTVMFGNRDPAEHLAETLPIQLHRRGSRTVLAIHLPGASKEEIDVVATGDELFVRVRDARRRVALPTSVVGREIEETRLERGYLEVVFAQ